MASVVQAGGIVVKISGNDAELQTAIKHAEKSLKRLDTMNGWFTGPKRTLLDTSVLLTTIGFAARTALNPIRSMISGFAGFEASMAKVHAVTKATTEQMKALREQAKFLGKTTFFTSAQVADAQKFLGMAGFNPEEILAGTPAVLNLALAGDMDLGEAADIASDISTPFKIAARNISRVVDVIAEAATSSNATVGMLGQSFKYLAPAASAAEQSIEECGAAVAILANNGLKADMAGTSVRQILVRLVDDKVQGKIKALGVEVLDAHGKMRPLLSILGDLKDATSDMGSGEAMGIFFDLFEARAGNAALALANAGNAVTEFRMKMMEAEGAAEKMAEIQTDHLGGDWKALVSAVEAVQLGVMEAWNTMARGWTQFGTKVIRGISDWISSHQLLVSILGKTLSAGVTFGAGILTISAIFKGLAMATAGAQAVYGALAAAFVKSGTASAVATTATNTQATAETAAATATTANTKAVTAETAALIANVTAKKANAAATAGSYTAYKSGQIYGVAGDSKRLGREATASVANAYAIAAQQKIATAGASTRLAGALVIERTATTAATAATVRAAVTARIGAVATATFTGVTKGASIALTGLKAAIFAIPGWGWALAGVAALTALCSWLTKTKDFTKSYSDSYNDFIEQSRSNHGSTQKTEAKKQSVSADLRMLDTLNEFSGKKLNQGDFDYSVQNIEKFQREYGNLGIVIDHVGRSFSLTAKSRERFEKVAGKKIAGQKRKELADFEKSLGIKEEELGYEENIHLNTWLSAPDLEKIKLLKSDVSDTKKKIRELKNEIKAADSGDLAAALGTDSAQAFRDQITANVEAIEKAEKRLAEITKQKSKERRSEIENEIESLRERTEVEKKHLQVLLKAEKQYLSGDRQQHRSLKKNGDSASIAEMARLESVANERIKRIADLENQLTGADKDLTEAVERLASKRVEAYDKMIRRESGTKLENAIAEIQQQSKEALDAVLSQMGVEGDGQRLAELHRKADQIRADSQRRINEAGEKNGIKNNDMASATQQFSVHAARNALNDAVLSGSADRITKAREELDKARKDLEMTSFEQTRKTLEEAKQEYEKLHSEFQNSNFIPGAQDEQKHLLSEKVEEARKKFEEINEKFEGMSEKLYNDRIKDVAQQKNVYAGTMSKYDILGGSMNTGKVSGQLDKIAKHSAKTEEHAKKTADNTAAMKNGFTFES